MSFKTTLIIGLGGVGSKIVTGIYKKFDASHPSDMDRRNVICLCLDTDQGDIKKYKEVLPEEWVIQTSSDLSATVSGYLDRIGKKCSVTEWFDTRSKTVLNMPLNKGAAQIRMTSRLAYMCAIDEGKMAAIDKSIAKLLATEPERKKGNIVNVHIICSLAGGTGAGTFLQVAYYVKNALKQNNVGAPEITGYFVLADVLANSDIPLSESQKQNIRSNTYACMKELVAFRSSDKGLLPIDFEYRLDQKSKSLPPESPYDACFLIDYTGAKGGNLMLETRYRQQVESLVYLLAFSEIGDNYNSMELNDARQHVDSDNVKKYASFGVSKLIYPVDDLFDYFATRRVFDNMRGTWIKIDKDYEEQYKQYRHNIDNGIPAQEPDRGEHFMDNVESMARTEGHTGFEFSRIYRGAYLLDKDMMPTKSKARVCLDAIKKRVRSQVEKSKTLAGLYEDCIAEMANFTQENEPTNDLNCVSRREAGLEEFRKKAVQFVENNQRASVEECFVNDQNEVNYVASSAPHRLNTYILEKDKEMHPLTVRYFLYNLRAEILKELEKKGDGAAKGLRGANKLLEDSINEYKLSYEIDDNSHAKQVTAVEYFRHLMKKSRLFAGNSIKRAKEEYETKSLEQAEAIRTFAQDKLFELTLEGLLLQVNVLIEEMEDFFNRLPDVIGKLGDRCDTLLHKHDKIDDPSASYVLASAIEKEDIYTHVISLNDSPFFPEEMSASLYRSMFNRVVSQLQATKHVTSRTVSTSEKDQILLNSCQKIIDECVTYQQHLIRKDNDEYARKNVIAALKEEAERMLVGREWSDQFEYMKSKFNAFRDKAEIWGASELDKETRFINAWGYNKQQCFTDGAITEAEKNELLGLTSVGTDKSQQATCVASNFFSPYEIVRVNTVTLLSVEKNFPAFVAKSKTEFAAEANGSYYQAYKEVIDRVLDKDTKTCSPHLDKRWHLPAYMPNIGCSMFEETKKMFLAMAYGLLFGKFKPVNNGGAYYWKHFGKVSGFMKDLNGSPVAVGASLSAALNHLFMEGLTNNPEIVDNLMAFTEEQWANAREQWMDMDTEGDELELMKSTDIIKTITGFRFDIPVGAAKQQPWFALLNAKKDSGLYKFIEEEDGQLKARFFDDLMERIIGVFGRSYNTQLLCEQVFQSMGTAFEDDTQARLETFIEEKRFEPGN